MYFRENKKKNMCFFLISFFVFYLLEFKTYHKGKYTCYIEIKKRKERKRKSKKYDGRIGDYRDEIGDNAGDEIYVIVNDYVVVVVGGAKIEQIRYVRFETWEQE